MSRQEDYVYYLKSEEAIRMADNRLNEITDEYWQTLNREFDEMKKNENEVREKYYQDMYRNEGKAEGIELGRKEGIALGREEGRTLGIAEGKVEGRTEGITETIRALSKTMSVEAIASALNKTTDEINEILKH